MPDRKLRCDGYVYRHRHSSNRSGSIRTVPDKLIWGHLCPEPLSDHHSTEMWVESSPATHRESTSSGTMVGTAASASAAPAGGAVTKSPRGTHHGELTPK